MQEQLRKAEEAVKELEAKRKDRWYPQHHIAARAGWINDPNGLCYFQGKYHVFFQHHPYSAVWGPMHWGHVSSTDLVHWKHEPIALAPSIEADRDGVFSGSAVISDSGELVVYYTGHRWRNGIDESEGNLQVQCMATSRDGIHFEKQGVVVESPAELKHFRDPKVWRGTDGTWNMIFGACSAENRGQVWLYTSQDMRTWAFERILFQDPNPKVFMLECPDMFPVGEGLWALVYSPMGTTPTGWMHQSGHNSGYVLGTWEPGQAFQAVTEYEHLDWGPEFYAPQSFSAPDGRRLLFGWMGAFVHRLPLAEDGWNGQLTLPREVSLVHTARGSRLQLQPVREIAESFPALSASQLHDATETGEVHICIDLSQTTTGRHGIELRGAFIGYDADEGCVVIDRRQGGNANMPELATLRGTPLFEGLSGPGEHDDFLELRIFIDTGSVEVFSNRSQPVSGYVLG